MSIYAGNKLIADVTPKIDTEVISNDEKRLVSSKLIFAINNALDGLKTLVNNKIQDYTGTFSSIEEKIATINTILGNWETNTENLDDYIANIRDELLNLRQKIVTVYRIKPTINNQQFNNMQTKEGIELFVADNPIHNPITIGDVYNVWEINNSEPFYNGMNYVFLGYNNNNEAIWDPLGKVMNTDLFFEKNDLIISSSFQGTNIPKYGADVLLYEIKYDDYGDFIGYTTIYDKIRQILDELDNIIIGSVGDIYLTKEQADELYLKKSDADNFLTEDKLNEKISLEQEIVDIVNEVFN